MSRENEATLSRESAVYSAAACALVAFVSVAAVVGIEGPVVTAVGLLGIGIVLPQAYLLATGSDEGSVRARYRLIAAATGVIWYVVGRTYADDAVAAFDLSFSSDLFATLWVGAFVVDYLALEAYAGYRSVVDPRPADPEAERDALDG